jgi:hypothetical protein
VKKIFRYLKTCSAFGLVLLIATHGIPAEKAGNVIKTDKAKTDGKTIPIDASTRMSSTHPEYDLSMTCVECHPTTCDALSSTTLLYINNLKRLERDELWKRIEAFLPGRERFILASSYANRPTATTIDFVLDPVDKTSYAVCEKGTHKLEQIKENPPSVWCPMRAGP